ncbi:MAG: zinc ribbon domain-containing protein [Bacillota bacterium]
MADFFDKIKQSVEKGVTTVSVKSKEALDSSKIKGEINILQQRRRTATEELGNIVYTMFTRKDFDEARLKEKCEKIAEIDSQLEVKQEELRQLHVKSQEVLGKPIIVGTCECGAKIAEGAKFCGKCGRKIAT